MTEAGIRGMKLSKCVWPSLVAPEKNAALMTVDMMGFSKRF